MEYAAVDEPKAIEYLKQGRTELINGDYAAAMSAFKACYALKITKKLAALLLEQMANCMDNLEHFDEQQRYLEQLCELELNFNNVSRLMRIYTATNNEVKLKSFAEKIRTLTAENEEEEKQALQLLAQAKDYDEVLTRSLQYYEKHPKDTDTARSIINTYIELKRIEDACAFEQTLEAEQKKFLCMELSRLKKEMYDLEGANELVLKHLEIHGENVGGVNSIAHGLVTGACYDGLLSKDEYVYWMRRAWEGTKPRVPINTEFNNPGGFFRKLRVGFVSYDFRAHSVGKFVMSLFDVIKNNTGIESYCYYTYPDYEDNFTAVFKERADKFKYVGNFSDKQLRKTLLDDKLDIIVDLNGQTAGTKLYLLAERFAPIQITWMGFPFSSFYYNVDYIMGDYFFDPEDGETGRYCTEKILRMQPSYMCFAARTNYYIEPVPPQVKNGYVTFGMMNTPQKFSKESIQLWQRCLNAVPNSRFFILINGYKGEFMDNKLRERLKTHGLDMSRVDLTYNKDGTPGYYGSYNLVDVMLDSFPFGGGTTTAEALWMGVPVIGCAYFMRHSRMAYSFMNNIGLGGLCAESIEEYPNKVKEVSQNAELLQDLRMNLRDRLLSTPLYDSAVFRMAFEHAVRDAWIDLCLRVNKSPPMYANNDETLARDTVRAADIVIYELTRERGHTEERLAALLNEYYTLNILLLERLFEIYKTDISVLHAADTAAQLLNTLKNAPDDETAVKLIEAIRTVIIKII